MIEDNVLIALPRGPASAHETMQSSGHALPKTREGELSEEKSGQGKGSGPFGFGSAREVAHFTAEMYCLVADPTPGYTQLYASDSTKNIVEIRLEPKLCITPVFDMTSLPLELTSWHLCGFDRHSTGLTMIAMRPLTQVKPKDFSSSVRSANNGEAKAEKTEVGGSLLDLGSSRVFNVYEIRVGDRVDCLSKDCVSPDGKWRKAKAVQVSNGGDGSLRVRVHYEAYASKFDEWVGVDENRLAKPGSMVKESQDAISNLRQTSYEASGESTLSSVYVVVRFVL
jgi:hypothetical protein